MFSWWRKWFKKKPASNTLDECYSEEPADPTLYFSTHRTHMRKGLVSAYIEHNAIPVKPEWTLHSGTAMDSSSQPGDTAKGAFVLNQQRLPQNLFSWYVSQGFIGYQACGIIAQQWMVNLACSIKGQDAVRNGFRIVANEGVEVNPQIIAAIEKADKRYKLKHHLRQAHKFNEVFGIRHVLFVVDSPDPDYYEKPFNPDSIKPGSYKGITQVDPYWITPLLDSDATAKPESQYFYEPTYWVISGRRYHRTHFVILRGPEVSDILKPSYIYGGLPLTQRIMERVYAAERTANEGPQLAMTKRLNVRKMNLAKAVANQEAFENALSVQSEYRDNYGILAIDQDEEAQQLETSLSDVDTVIMTQYQIVAAVAGVPATKLLRTSPKGFNATGEHEIKTYHEELETVQECDLTPIVDKHHLCVMRSTIVPRFNGRPFDITVVWNPVDVPSQREVAETQEIQSRADTNYQNTGAIDAYDIRDRLINDEEGLYSGLEVVERPEDLDDLEPEPVPGEPAPQQTEFATTTTDEDPLLAPLPEETAQDVLREEGGQWYVYSETGKKLGGPYSNKKKARNRLRQIEYFKHEN